MITNLNNQVFNVSKVPGKSNNPAMTNISKVLSMKIAEDTSDSSAISSTMKGKMRELDQSARYAQEGVAIAQTAQEGLAKIEENLTRMKELVTMATGVDLTDEDREKIQKEINGLNKKITDVAKETKYNGYNLLTPGEGEEGAEEGAEIEETEKDAAVKKFLDAMGVVDFTAKGLGTDKIDVSTAESALEGLDIVNQAIAKVKEQQNEYKAYEQQLINIFKSEIENENSQDYNAELAANTLELLKYKMSNEPIISCLANSNQSPENVQNLLTDK